MNEIALPTAEQIETAARERGLSPAQMCRRADIDHATFSRWKNGHGTPTLTTIQKMLDAIEREPTPEAI